ncbi:hypothetical protein [Trinickia diaoshuihuensis]|uniref:hypothetical protein n=1 Tax=Trinickia diaoshuihuensis TaxID=2292265 RepID=UPI000E266965|nr:hypothetical protein [Trinickia diaoshuihuensis]
MSVSFLGLDKEHWDLINSFANWVSAFGTVAAVSVSLWLAFRQDRISLGVAAGVRVVVAVGVKAPQVRYITISAVNRGKRLAKIQSIGWSYRENRWKKRRYLFQGAGDQTDGMSSPVPIVLDDGQQAQWMFEKARWLGQLEKLHIPKWNRIVDTFTVEIYTSVGKTFRAPAEQSLKDALAETFKEIDRRRAAEARTEA